MMKTITFDEDVKGWTSFFSFEPEFMVGLNGKFFTFNNGEVYQHNSKNVPRNNFYGTQYTSKVSVVMNDNPSTEKMFKNIMLEGNNTWDIALTTNLTQGNIFKDEFTKRKSRYFAYTRRNEDDTDLTSFAANGIGNTNSTTANSLFFDGVNEMVCIGDKVTQIQSGIAVELGIITDIHATGEVVFSTFENTPSVGEFCYATKNSRVEGGEMRGYYMRADLESDATDFCELFAITSNTAESYV